MKKESLEESFSKELIKETNDPIIDISEIGLDNIFNNKIVDAIPVVKIIAAACKIGLNVRDRYFAKKLVTFINEFRKGKLKEDKYNEFKGKMKGKKYRSKVTETIIIKLDALDSINKVTILCKLFNTFINGKISWEEFKEFSNITNYLVKEDYEVLESLNKDPNNNICFSNREKPNVEGSAYKLVQYSLATYRIDVMTFTNTSNVTIVHKTTEKGTKLYNSLNTILKELTL